MLTRDEFFKKFPHVFDLPMHPQCRLCFSAFQWTVTTEGGADHVELTEYHREGCPKYERNMQIYQIGSTPKVEGAFPNTRKDVQFP